MKPLALRACLLVFIFCLFSQSDVNAAVDAGTLAEPMESGKDISGTGVAGSGLDSFKTDLFTGTASYSIPIAVPPGTGGMQPGLSLSYNSGAPNGWVGFGWSLGMGAISRSTKNGVPAYGPSDEFVLGGNRLIPEEPPGDPHRYHTERESFQKIMYDDVADSWTVTAPNGTKLYFGSTSSSRIAHPGLGQTFSWLLDKVEDTHSNSLQVSYVSFAGDPEPDPGVLYLRKIEYTFHDGVIVGDHRRVEFCLEGETEDCDEDAGWQDPEQTKRPDVLVNYMGGFESRMTRRLKVIRVTIDTPPIEDALVRKYVLEYEQYPPDPPEEPGKHFRSLIASVTQKGKDNGPLPPITFSYTQMVPGFDATPVGWANPSGDQGLDKYRAIRPGKAQKTHYALIDIDGDGVLDRVTNRDQDNFFRIYLRRADFETNPGYGEVDSSDYDEWDDTGAQGMPDITQNEKVKAIRDQSGNDHIKADLIDLDGDALPDRVLKSEDPATWKVGWNLGNEFGPATNPWQNPSNALGTDYRDLIVFLAPRADPPDVPDFSVIATVMDLNGDGLPDRLARSGSNWYVYWSDGVSGFGPAQTWNNTSQYNVLIKVDKNSG